MKKGLTALMVLVAGSLVWGQSAAPAAPEASRCHAFIDTDFIWTLEMVQEPSGRLTPILNIVTLIRGQWEFRPNQVRIYGRSGREATLQRFSIETGADPYVTEYFKVLGNSFIGLDLIGSFEDEFAEPSRVAIDLGNDQFELQVLGCLEFDRLVDQINQINFDSPRIEDDFEVLRIEPVGKREYRPQPRYP